MTMIFAAILSRKGTKEMLEILVVFLVIGLIILTAFAAFMIGVYAATKNNIEKLKRNGWTVEPPRVGGEENEID